MRNAALLFFVLFVSATSAFADSERMSCEYETRYQGSPGSVVESSPLRYEQIGEYTIGYTLPCAGYCEIVGVRVKNDSNHIEYKIAERIGDIISENEKDRWQPLNNEYVRGTSRRPILGYSPDVGKILYKSRTYITTLECHLKQEIIPNKFTTTNGTTWKLFKTLPYGVALWMAPDKTVWGLVGREDYGRDYLAEELYLESSGKQSATCAAIQSKVGAAGLRWKIARKDDLIRVWNRYQFDQVSRGMHARLIWAGEYGKSPYDNEKFLDGQIESYYKYKASIVCFAR